MLCSKKDINQVENQTKVLWIRIRNPLGTKGLYLKVNLSGGKVIYYRYNLPTGTKRYLICQFGEMELPDIFVLHKQLSMEVKAGGDPMTERQRTRQQLTVKLDKPKLYNEILDLWMRDYANVNLAGSTYSNSKSRLKKWIRPQLGKVAIDDLEPHHFKAMRDKAMKAGKDATANQTLQLCKTINSWAVDELLMKSNEAIHIRKIGKVTPRNVVWTEEQFKTIWQALSGEIETEVSLSLSQCLAIKFILVTGMRRAEGALLKRDEIVYNELENTAEITLPPERVKISREHIVWCSQLATSLLKEAMAISQHPQQVFVGKNSRIGLKPNSLSNLFTALLKQLEIEGVLHDARHSYMTVCMKGGCDPIGIDHCLGHIGLRGSGAIYNHAGNMPKMKQAWQYYSDWVARVCGLDGGDSGKSNVIQMPVLEVREPSI